MVYESISAVRSGYSPNDYPTEAEWRAREMIEKSSATKCPTIAYQLAGAKRIQQRLCEPGVLERFLPANDSNLLRECFAGARNCYIKLNICMSLFSMTTKCMFSTQRNSV